MRNSNIIRMDSKGRVLIPSHIRTFLKADEGTEMIVIPDEEHSHLKILPIVKEKTAELKFLLNDLPGSLAGVADVLAEYNINILMSESRSLVRGELAEWDIIVDTSKCNGNMELVKEKLLKSNFVRNMEVVRK